MWPGTSRSLVTILAALAIGASLAAAVEFSFLLGLATLSAATLYEAAKNGSEVIDAYGWIDPIVGMIAAFVAAVVAVRWMVSWLQTRSLAVFGWERLVVAGGAIALLAAGVIAAGTVRGFFPRLLLRQAEQAECGRAYEPPRERSEPAECVPGSHSTSAPTAAMSRSMRSGSRPP